MRILIILFIFIFPILTFSQDSTTKTFTISGKIIDKISKKPIEYATIIFKSIDSVGTIKFGGIANRRGKFSIDVEKGVYLASVECISYKTKQLDISEINHDFNIGTIEIEVNTEVLNEIEIYSTKKTLEIKPNKLVINVSEDVASHSSMATDILNNIPCVSVNPDGAIKLDGVNTPTVLINGKASMLSKGNVLKSLPASSIEKIEILSNSKASFKASSTGIINIILKKGKKEGFSSSITTSAGYKNYYGGLVNLNYKSKKINAYFYPSYIHKNDIKTASTFTEYFNNTGANLYFDKFSNYSVQKNDFTSILGADFYLSKNTTLSTAFNYSGINNKNTTKTDALLYDSAKTEISNNHRILNGKFDDQIFETTLGIEHNFKNENTKLSSSFTYSSDTETYNNDITNSNSEFTSESYIEKNKIENYIVDTKFTAPITKTSSYTIGYYGEFGKLPFSYTSNLNVEKINYNENLNAAFIDFEKEFNKLYISIGLRTEFVKTTINYESLAITQKKNYKDFVPSTYLEYAINENKKLSFSYSKNILRPGYEDLKPFEQKYSETLSFVGNVELKPIYLNMTRLSYTFIGKKITIKPSIYLNIYNDFWQRVTYETGKQVEGIDKLITTPKNVGKVNYYGTEITLVYSPTNWLSFTGYANLYNFDQKGVFETTNTVGKQIVKDYTNKSFSGSQSFSTKIKIPKVFNFQVNIKNKLRSVSNFSTRKAFTYASIAISKDLLDNSATISLSSNDIFNSYITNRDRYDDAYFLQSKIAHKYQTIILSFTYRLNQKKRNRKINFDKKDIKPEF